MRFSTQLIDSFPLTYSMRRCAWEKLSIPLEVHHKAQLSENFLSFPAKNWKSCNFLSFGQSCWNCIFKRPRWRALKRRMACLIPAKKSCSSHLFGGGPKPGCSNRLCTGIIESHNLFCLRSYLGEISHSSKERASSAVIFYCYVLSFWKNAYLNSANP